MTTRTSVRARACWAGCVWLVHVHMHVWWGGARRVHVTGCVCSFTLAYCALLFPPRHSESTRRRVQPVVPAPNPPHRSVGREEQAPRVDLPSARVEGHERASSLAIGGLCVCRRRGLFCLCLHVGRVLPSGGRTLDRRLTLHGCWLFSIKKWRR